MHTFVFAVNQTDVVYNIIAVTKSLTTLGMSLRFWEEVPPLTALE